MQLENEQVLFTQEFFEKVESVLLQLHTKKRAISFATSKMKIVNAFAMLIPTENLGREYLIMVYEGLMDAIAKESYGEPVKKLLTDICLEYNIENDMDGLQHLLFTVAMLTCFFHEVGHILNGHFLPSSNLSLQNIIFNESEQLCQKDPRDYAVRSFLEHDADYYAGKALAPLPDFLQLEINDKIHLGDAQKKLILLGIFVLFMALKDETNMYVTSPKYNPNLDEYPPLMVRTISTALSFNVNHGYFLKHGSLDGTDLTPSDEHWDECIKLVKQIQAVYPNNIVYTNEQHESWKERFKNFPEFISKIHKNAAIFWEDFT